MIFESFAIGLFSYIYEIIIYYSIPYYYSHSMNYYLYPYHIYYYNFGITSYYS